MGRVRYGFSKLHYAVATEGAGGALTYGTPTAIPGAKSLTMTPAGASFEEPADNVTWFSGSTNSGYTGELVFEDTAAADAFMTEVLGRTKNATSGLVVEKATDKPVEFALLGQFELAGGTEVGKRECFYRCVASRPNVEGSTTEGGNVTIATNTINITSMPRINDAAVKVFAVDTDAAYANWFTAVPEAA